MSFSQRDGVATNEERNLLTLKTLSLIYNYFSKVTIQQMKTYRSLILGAVFEILGDFLFESSRLGENSRLATVSYTEPLVLRGNLSRTLQLVSFQVIAGKQKNGRMTNCLF